MKLALIGHGAMGRLVEARARDEGHEVATVLGSRESAFRPEELAGRSWQLVPTRLNLTVLYIPGSSHSRLITWTSADGRNWT